MMRCLFRRRLMRLLGLVLARARVLLISPALTVPRLRSNNPLGLEY